MDLNKELEVDIIGLRRRSFGLLTLPASFEIDTLCTDRQMKEKHGHHGHLYDEKDEEFERQRIEQPTMVAECTASHCRSRWK